MKKYLAVALMVLVMMFGTVANADTNDVWPGTWSTPADLTMQVFPSVSNLFSFTTNTTYAFAWNGIDSAVNIDSLLTSTNTDGNKSIRVYSMVLAGNVIGQTDMYYGPSGAYLVSDVLTFAGTYTKACVFLDSTPSTGSGSLLALALDTQKGTYMHELGHALAMAHPTPGETDFAVMWQLASPTYRKNTVQTHDRNNLSTKY